jgi:hypothetical protein
MAGGLRTHSTFAIVMLAAIAPLACGDDLSSALAPSARPAVEEPFTQAPVPGAAGAITVVEADFDSVELAWTKASDDLTAAGALHYRVFHTDVAEIKSLLHASIVGIGGPTLSDADTFRVDGLSPSRLYHFNVVVEDQHLNRAIYAGVSAATAADPATGAGLDAVYGEPSFVMPESTALTITDVTPTGMTVDWAKATEADGKPALEYQVYVSRESELDALDDVLGLGVAKGDAVVDGESLAITGLTHGVEYAANVVVVDGAGNKALYTATSVTTTDDVVPTLPASPTPTVTVLSSTSIRLTWSKAADNATGAAALTYQVYRSDRSDLVSPAAAAQYGGKVGEATADLATLDVSGLATGVTQYFTVVVSDAAGNAVSYPVVSATP